MCDVRLVINYGPPDDLEQYLQMAGRGGRDGQTAFSIILYHGLQLKTATDGMISFINRNDNTCKRQKLAIDFEIETPYIVSKHHNCCDVCKKMCKCDVCCTSKENVSLLDICLHGVQATHLRHPLPEVPSRRREVTTEQTDFLHSLLLHERKETLLQLSKKHTNIG